jgi:hypothetical protein
VKGTVTVSAGSTFEVAGTLTVDAGTVTVAEDVTITLKGGTIETTNAGSVGGDGTVEGTGTVSGSGVTIIDEDSGSTIKQDVKALKVDAITTATGKTTLSEAITKVKTDVYKDNRVIFLTEDFYTAANQAGTIIIVDGSATDNTIPYTIKGLGTATTDTALTVGIGLGNDNVTLDGVKFTITNSSRLQSDPLWMNSYKAVIAITRHNGSVLYTDEADMVNNKVTVKNCAITYTATTTNMSAGIYVGGTGQTPATNITIIGNTVNVTGFNSYAAQALLLRRYDPSMEITNNTLHADNTGTTNAWDYPASALYMQIDPRNVSGSGKTPNISGNTLSGTFAFYMNILGYGGEKGIPQMFADKFGTVNTTWATASTTDKDSGKSFYKKVFDAFMASTFPDGAGYGFIFMEVDGAEGGFDDKVFALEQYDITNSQVAYIDFWGPEINTTGYVSTTTINPDGNLNGDAGHRDRITVDNNGVPDPSSTTSNNFHWTKTTEGTDLP